MTAIGALYSLQELNILVPDQVSLIGFDNEIVLDYLTPTVSSVQLSVHSFVTHAMNLLLAKRNNFV